MPRSNGSTDTASAAHPPGETDGDTALLQAAVRGDRRAFSQLVERHQGMVFGYLRARVLQPTDAEDLTQEVFLRCYQGWDRFDGGQSVRPWLLGIARNVLREHLRRFKRRKEVGWTTLCLDLDELSPPEDPGLGEVVEHLPGCLQGLGTSAREAIEMRYDNRLRMAEIGERLKRSEGAAKLLMFRARQALKLCLDRKCRGESE